MKILFWVPYPTGGASNRYRIEQYLPFLDAEGLEYTLSPFWCSPGFKILYQKGHKLKKFCYFIFGSIVRMRDILKISQYDIVFIHRESYPIGGPFFENVLSILNKPFIYDFDDALFLSACSDQNSFIGKFKSPRKIAKIIKMSKHVIAGNSYLADFSLCHNRTVSVIPTAVDTGKYYPVKYKSKSKIEIGWIGSVTTSDFLNTIKDVFIKLSQVCPDVDFRVVGVHFSINGLDNVISRPWALETELDELRFFDIGIMPMPDNEWTRGKCGFKAILYMSMGIPCVCSPVGINKEIIKDGVNGFLADSQEEWTDKLLSLIKNPELRLKIGSSGRQAVKERYSVQANAPKFLEVIHDVYGKYGKK